MKNPDASRIRVFSCPAYLPLPMNPIDHWISLLGSGPGTVLVMAALLGLRHATDPDHIAAVSTLVLANQKDGVRRARILGTAWGLGHGVTLLLFGLPII